LRISDCGFRIALEERRRLIAAVLIFAIVFGAVVLTARDPGLTWDEGIYYGFALRYVAWFGDLSQGSFSADNLARYWRDGQAHPPLGKLCIALSMVTFGIGADLITAARIAPAVQFALAAMVLYLWVCPRRGQLAGIAAAATFALMPRIFAHGHFANLEMPTVLLWLLTIIAFEKGIRNRRWSVACGALFGLALLTKVNAVFLPVVLAPWGIAFHRRKAVRNLIAMAAIGPALFLLGWPALWRDPFGGAWSYLTDKAGRMIVPTYYLGTTYADRFAPFHYPFVMLLATTPLPVLAAAGAGATQCVRRLRAAWREAPREALLLWGVCVPALVLALPAAPKYDGVRLMLPAYPFLAVLAAEGAAWAWERLRRKLKKPRTVGQALAAVAALWLLAPVVMFHPFQLCYYGELVGGPWGAEKLGFETTYWGDTLNGDALAWLDRHVPERGRVALVAVGSLVWQYYVALGEARKDIRLTDFEPGDWDYVVVVPRQGMLGRDARKFMKTHKPAWVNALAPFGRPPVCLIYSRR